MITYSINAHPVIALMFSQTGTDVLPRRDEGSDKPSATIEPHRIMVPTRTRTQAAGLKVRCRYHYTTAAHRIVALLSKTLSLHYRLLPQLIFHKSNEQCVHYTSKVVHEAGMNRRLGLTRHFISTLLCFFLFQLYCMLQVLKILFIYLFNPFIG